MNAIPIVHDWPADPADALPLALWDSATLATVMGGVASEPFEVSGVEIDSRDVISGDLFFALKGEAMDGHRFVEAAFAAGATAAVVASPIKGPHILVDDTMVALEKLAHAARARGAVTVIGVTGSVGKTGVKEAIFAALNRASLGNAHRSVKSYNNHVGVPLSLARLPARAEYGIFEMGMSNKGEIAALTQFVRPHVAVITTIAPAHIEALGSEEAIADAKAEIFEGLVEGGIAVIPADSPHYARLRTAAEKYGARVICFGRADYADVRLLDAVMASNGGSLVTADMGEQRVCYTVAAPGDHWVVNSLAVMAVVHAVGGDLGAAGVALADMPGLPGRGARETIAVSGGSALLLDESYNANPASMMATLTQLSKTPGKRRIAVLGAMKELGSHSASFHAGLADPLRASGAEMAFLVGEEMLSLVDELGKSAGSDLGNSLAFAHCYNVAEVIIALQNYGLQSDDVILVKGSNSVGLGRLVAEFVTETKS